MAKEILSIDLANNLAPEISMALWQLEDSRKRTLAALKDLPEAALDWEMPNYPNSIGTLLYHIAAIEADWLFADVLQGGFERVESWFPHEVRDETGRLTPVRGATLKDYLARLEAIREEVRKAFKNMRLEAFHHLSEFENYHVSPAWVLHHLSQHEAQHRGEILVLHEMFRQQN